MADLKSVEINNFKSYIGPNFAGPLKDFNAIVGPNGCGKSNLMDAISFVLCAKTSSLRVQRLRDLVYGGDDSEVESCSVSGLFSGNGFESRKFTRTVRGATTSYRIDGQGVSYAEYLEALKEIGIDSKRQNFLVFQGNINSVALKSPKELTMLFEDLSGSCDFKEQYDQLSEEMKAAKNAMLIAINEKKVIMRQFKVAEKQVAEIRMYKNMENELAAVRLELQLFQLYHCEKVIRSLDKERKSCEAQLATVEHSIRAVEDQLKDVKKAAGVAHRELADIEQKARTMEVEVNKKRLNCIKTKEQVSHATKKLECARKSLVQAQKAEEVQSRVLDEYTTELADLEKRWQHYERQIAAEHVGLDISLQQSQIEEYEQLKQEAGQRSSLLLQELDKLERKHKLRQDLLDNESRKKKQMQDTIKWRVSEKDKLEGRMDKLADFIKSVEESLERHRAERDRLLLVVDSSKDRSASLELELESVVLELREAKSDSSQSQRDHARSITLDNLKKQFAGVYGRMYELCKPVNQRYYVAITKVMGSHMDAIVVDSAATACDCIMFLKRHVSERETFLPLDSLRTKPLKPHLRNITEVRNVKLLFDVLNFSPASVEKAVWFVTANVLVCESPEDAQYVAYRMESRATYNAVSLDGTYYTKTGIISGGQVELARKARKWDEKRLNELKARKATLLQELSETRRELRLESELKTLSIIMSSSEARLKTAAADRNKMLKRVDDLSAEIETLKTEVESADETIAGLQQHMKSRESVMADTRSKLHLVEDIVFRDFCQRVGILNIRQYEETHLRTHEESAEKRLEFENQKSRIVALLDVEKSKDMSVNVQRWSQAVLNDERALAEAQQTNDSHKQVYEEALARLDALRSQQSSQQACIKALEDDIKKVRHKNSDAVFNKTVLQKQLIVLDSKIEQQKVEKRKIFKDSKVEGIALPLKEGNINDIFLDTSVDTSTGESSASTRPSQGFESITVDYSMLRQAFKNIANAEEMKETVAKLQKDILEREAAIADLVAPNLKAGELQEGLRLKMVENHRAYKSAYSAYQQATVKFTEVQCLRRSCFMKCFDKVSEQIDIIYKDITGSPAGVALLTLEDDSDPYSGGTQLCCIVPGKSCLSLASLSGGEQTVLGLALIYACFSFNPSPLLILDEIDVALDNVSVNRIIKYLKKRSSTIQTIVISHKEELFANSQVLLGVNTEIEGEIRCSRVLTLNLEEYPQTLLRS